MSQANKKLPVPPPAESEIELEPLEIADLGSNPLEELEKTLIADSLELEKAAGAINHGPKLTPVAESSAPKPIPTEAPVAAPAVTAAPTTAKPATNAKPAAKTAPAKAAAPAKATAKPAAKGAPAAKAAVKAVPAPKEAAPKQTAPADSAPAGNSGDGKAKDDKAPKKIVAPKVPWRNRISLSAFVSYIVLGSIFLACGGLGWYALTTLYKNKLQDIWAITFLELEEQGNQMLKRIGQTWDDHADGTRAALSNGAQDGVLRIVGNNAFQTVRGDFPYDVPVKAFLLKDTNTKSRWNIWQFGGKNYLAVRVDNGWITSRYNEPVARGEYMNLVPLDLSRWFDHAGTADDKKNTFYLLTREGRLVYTNHSDITAGNYMSRPLVQKFINSPVRQGQVDFDGEDGPSYGFFFEVPETNLLMFAETSKRVALAPVRAIATNYALTILFVLCAVALAIQVPISNYVVAPLRELVQMADEVGDGNFDINVRRQGLGELYVLSRSFVDMAKNLVTRDKKIQGLLVVQEEKLRLKEELALAQSIQDNFLLDVALPKEAGLEVAAQYTPCTECAGDWYGYFYDPITDQSVCAVADVSGHGAASAMFTAIIASTFEEMRISCSQRQEPFSLEDLTTRLNRLIHRLGKGNMHATLVAARFHRPTATLSVVNAGHPFPILLPPAEDGRKGVPLAGASDALGLSDTITPVVSEVEFLPGMSLFMYTDGLVEGRPDKKLYTERRINKAVKLQPGQNINQMVIRVYEDWRKFLDGLPPTDDVCLLAMRATS